MNSFLHDVRFALRTLAKDFWFSTLVVFTLGIGIGANSTIFSWISSTLLDPIPGVSKTLDIVTVMRGERSDHPTPPFSYLDYRDLRDTNHSFTGLIAFHHDYVSLTGTGKPERVYATLSSANYFDVLGARPILGRGFLPSEERLDASAPVIVISYALWQTHFGGARSVIGKTVQINRQLYTIVGVAPRGFQGCMTGLRTDIWVPLVMIERVWGWDPISDRGGFVWNVFGRLKPGVNRHQAEADLNLLMQRIVERFPETHRGPNAISMDPLWRSPFGVNVYLYQSLPMLLALAAVLLLLACANVANLLLLRSIGRRREIAIRMSIGATRWQLVRQLVTEGLLLSLAGGVLATLITEWSSGTLAAFLPPAGLPLTVNGRLDTRVVLATAIASVLTTLIFGLLPALRASGAPVISVLKEEAGSAPSSLSKARMSSSLVVVQIALSLLLLVSAGLFTRSLERAQQEDPGFDPEHVLLESYELGPAGYTVDQAIAFNRQVLAKIEALPGVESATLADFSPQSFSIHSDAFLPEGYVPQPHESLDMDCGAVGPHYLRTMRTPLVAGRDFTEQDTEHSQFVAIVNDAFVKRYWPGEDAIGRRIVYGREALTVVGVVRNGKYRMASYAPQPTVFMPIDQDFRPEITLHVRVAGNPMSAARAVEAAVHDLNPDLPVFDVITLKSSMRLGRVFQSLAATFTGSFGLLALILAGVGIYGVVAFTTRQRTREIGIRMALGAEKGQVFRNVLAHGLRLTFVGLALGAGLSLIVTRSLRGLLYGVAPTDLVTFAAVAIVLTVVAVLACYIPARRAMNVNPLVALRSE